MATDLQSSKTEVLSIVIDSTKVDNSSFTLSALCDGPGVCTYDFDYEADSDIYRLEETVPEPL